jgi:lysophospholipase L1-like esterase
MSNFGIDSNMVFDINGKSVFTRLAEIDDDNQKKRIYFMPQPSTDKTVNTQRFNDLALNALTSDLPIEIRFPNGWYEVQTLFVHKNTTVKMNSGTTLNFTSPQYLNPETGNMATVTSLFMNARVYHPDDSNFTGYNGNGNITIEGGTAYGGCFMTMIHGYNITVRNVKIKDATADHCFQVNSSKNVLIEGCELNGVPVQDASRNYVEMIQIDWCTATGVPGWASTAPIYDHTTNDGVIIRNCKFGKSENLNNLQTIYTAVGSHSSDGTLRNKNILIEGCTFNDSTYANIHALSMDNVTIRNNRFNSSDINGNLLHVDTVSNLAVYGNTFNGGRRAMYLNNANGVHFHYNDVYGGYAYQIFATEDVTGLTITNNKFKDFMYTTSAALAIIALRSVANFFVSGNTAENVYLSPVDSGGVAQDTMFVFVYATSGYTSNNGYVGRNMIDDYTKITLDSKITYSNSVNVTTESQFSGLTWVSVGDSITNGNNLYNSVGQGYYQETALPLLRNVKKHYKRGYGGYCYSKSSTSAWSSILDVDSQFETADVYTVFLGTNDFSRNVPIGSTADAQGTLNSLWGGMKQLYVDLRAKNPIATIIIITPLKRTSSPAWNTTNSLGLKMDDYVAAIKAFAAQYALPVIDLYNISGINTATDTNFLFDGLHPNLVGNVRVGKLIANQMNTYI